VADHVDDAFEILKNIHVPKSQNAKTYRFKDSRALAIACEPVPRVVLSAVELDDEPAFVTGEVGDEARNWYLTAKVSSLLLKHTQRVPKLLLGIGNIAAQLTCKVIGHHPTPTPNPSPQGGGE
jgi:hypothetical protein